MEPFIAQIMLFGGNFAPRGWAFCDGQLLPIAQYQALFSLLGTTYGGDGRTTFALPDLRGRVPVHPGQGPGLTQRNPGESFGTESVTLTGAEMPSHNHQAIASAAPAATDQPTGGLPGRVSVYVSGGGQPTTPLASNMIGNAGGNQPHNNMQPSLGVNYIIALEGIYPSRS